MPINPFRIGDMSAPEQVKFPGTADFSGIASLGASIGQYRDQQEVSRIMAGAVDPRTGALDLQKAASALAVTGRDPRHYLDALAREQALKQAQAHFEITSKIQQQAADAAEVAANRPTVFHEPASITRPATVTTVPRTGGQPTVTPLPMLTPGGAGAVPAPPTIGPRSELPGGPNVAGFNPEEAPPYRVAGPMMPPPQPEPLATPAQAAPATPAPAQPRSQLAPEEDAWLQKYYPGAADTVRGLIDMSRDPHKIPGTERERQDLFGLASRLRPGWSPENYGKQETKIPVTEGEKLGKEGGKFQEIKSFVDRFDDKYTTGGIGGYLGLGSKAINLGMSSPEALAKAKGISVEDAIGAVNYWNQYNALKNVVRNAQFGASLTAGEQKAFDSANITPDMDPRIVRANLAKQYEVLRGAMLRQAEGMIANEVPRDKIEAYYGTSIENLRKPIAPPEVSGAPGARTIVPVQNDAQAQQMIGYATKAWQDGKITYEQAVEDLRRAKVPYPERVLRR